EMFNGNVADIPRFLSPYEARRALYEAGYDEDEIERALEGLEALASERARRAGAAQQTSGSPGRPPEESAASGRGRRLSPTAEFDYVVARAPGGEEHWVDLFLSEGEDVVLRRLREAQSLILGDGLWRRRGYPNQEAFERAFLLGLLERSTEMR